MESSTYKNYEELCRLCASYDAVKLPIFSDGGKERRLKDKITTCLPFDVSEDDLFPKSLCYRCIYNLENFYDFRRGCIDARSRLEKVIKEVLNTKTRLRDDVLESDGDSDSPNPVDFLEACLAESPHQSSHASEEERTFICEVCNRHFNSKSSLNIHARTCFQQDLAAEPGESSCGNYSCFVCSKRFSSKGHLALHSKVHFGGTNSPSVPYTNRSNTNLHTCDLCNKSFAGTKHLWGHVSAAHKGHPSLTCGLCQKTFSSISNLEDHKRSKHKNGNFSEQVSISPLPSKSESNVDILQEEIPSSRRKSSKPRKIERDGSISLNSELRMDTYSNTQNTETEISKNDITPKDIHLNNHLTKEQGLGSLDANSNGCPDSGEEFAESLMESETVFCCEICVREFSDRGSLWLHLLYTHKNAASKACGICLKICENTESLLHHVESVHPKGQGDGKSEQRRYSCQVCARQHDSRKKLVSHARIHKLVDADGNLVDPETVVVQNAEFHSDGFLPQNTDSNYSSCDLCFKVFENDLKLAKHKRVSHRDSLAPNSHINSGSYNLYFACEICGLSHLSRSDRWKHMATCHAGNPSVTCEVPECGKVFSTSSLKTGHAAHHTAQGQYPNTCEVCGKMWKTRVEYWKHMMGVHPDYLPFICGVCLKVFCNLTNLVRHVRETHWPLLGGDFCCDICGRPYSKVSKMSRHRKVHCVPDNPPELQALLACPKIQNESHYLNKATNLICDMCENSSIEYETLEILGKHRLEVHSALQCDLCTKYYGRTSHLWKHVNKIHKGHPDVTCPTCQRTSASKSHLATHIAKHHRTEEKTSTPRVVREPNGQHSCEKCSKIFRKESLVKKHSKHCKGPRPTPISVPPPVDGIYQCDRCDKSFSVRNFLYKHLKHSHLLFNCELCDTKTNSRTELYQHICASHADDPNVKCDKCDKLLRCKADLDRHKKGHSLSVQLHCCKFCAELVTSKYKLRRHLKAIHGNESKFLCALCLKALPGIKELILHVEANHKSNLDRGFTCQICAKPCTSKSKLLEHIKYHGTSYLPCKICLKVFPSKQDLNSHLENHPNDSDDENDSAENDITSSKEKEISNDTVKEENNPKMKEQEIFDENDEEEENEKPRKRSKLEVECSVCKEIFYSKMALRRHLKSVHDMKSVLSRYSAENLDSSEAFLDKSEKNLWESSADSNTSFLHQLGLMPESKPKVVRKVYNDDEKPAKCDLCGKVWTAKKHLWQHLIRYHKNDCGRTCGVCLKLCPDYPSLSIHLATEHPDNFENDPSVLICRVCGKYHNAKSKLHNHASVHGGHEERAIDPNHWCLVCDKSFTKFNEFCNHLEADHNIGGKKVLNEPAGMLCVNEPNSIKTESKTTCESPKKLPFHTCDVCSLVFASEVGLTNHKRIHENSDNFKCGQCGEVFQSAENLCTHKLQKHKGTEFVCADCKSNFSTYNQLTEHNKMCKMKLNSLNDNSDDELILDDDMEDLDTSFEVHDPITSSESEDPGKSEFPDYNMEHDKSQDSEVVKPVNEADIGSHDSI